MSTKCAIMAGFCIQSTRESDVVSYGYPCAFLLESSPSSWETTECSSLFWSSRRFCHHFAGRGRGLWLSFSASSNVPHGRQKPTRAATTAREVSVSRKEASTMASRQLAHVTFNGHMKNYSSCPQTNLGFYSRAKK